MLEPAACVHQQCKGCSVAFWKAVFAKALDLFKYLLCKLFLVAPRCHAVHNLGVVLLHTALALPRGHGAAQAIGLAGGKASGQHGDLHDLLLKHWHPQRAPQRLLQLRTGVAHRLFALAPVQIRMHHAALNRPGSHNGHLNDQIVKTARLQPGQHRHLRPALDLKHPHGVGLADHVVGAGVFGGDVLHRKHKSAPCTHQVQCLANGGQHAQGQHVYLQQTHGIQIVFVPFDDRAVFHRCRFYRHHARQRPTGQHKAPGVLRQMAWKAHELRREQQPLLHSKIVCAQAHLGQALRVYLSAVPSAVQLSQLFHHVQAKAQGFAHIADGGLGPVRDHHRGERRAVAPILLVEVLDHFFAPLVFKINVNIWRLVALFANKALKQNAHALGVYLGDIQAVADHRVCRAATALAQNMARAGEGHDVVDGQKIRLVLELADQLQLVLYLVLHLGAHALWPSAPGAFVGYLAQIRLGRLPDRNHFLRVLVLQLV